MKKYCINCHIEQVKENVRNTYDRARIQSLHASQINPYEANCPTNSENVYRLNMKGGYLIILPLS